MIINCTDFINEKLGVSDDGEKLADYLINYS